MKFRLPGIRRSGTLRKLAGALGLLLALGLLATSAGTALAESLSPGHMFYGLVTIDASAAPDGTLVQAKIDGVVYASQTTVAGQYGYSSQFMVPQDDPNTDEVKDGGVAGDDVLFYVNGVYAAMATFEPGAQSRLDLAIVSGGPDDYDLTVTSNGCCDIQVEYGEVVATVDGGTSQTFYAIEEDTVVDLTAVESETCEFVNWQVDQGTPTTNNPISVTMDADHTAVATCQPVAPPETYDLTVTSSGCCDILVEYGQVSTTVNGGTSQTFYDIEENTDVELIAESSQDCEFVSWQVDQETPVSSNPITVTMDADHTAVALCQVIVTYDLTVTSNGCCDIHVEYGQVSTTVNGGTSHTFYGIVEDTMVSLETLESLTCEFVNWQVDQAAPVTTNPITVTMDGDHVAVATCQTVEPADISFSLNAGWNTFSIPIALDPSMDTWGEFIAYNSLGIDAAIGYNSELDIWVNCMNSDYLKVLDGYYIHLTSPAIVEILPNPGTTFPPSKSLTAGLNFVGLASLTDEDVSYVLNTVYEIVVGDRMVTGYRMVLNPPVNGGGWSTYLRDDPAPLMRVGKAYWVIMATPGDLFGFTQTPLEN